MEACLLRNVLQHSGMHKYAQRIHGMQIEATRAYAVQPSVFILEGG